MSSSNKIAEGQFSGTGGAFFKIYIVNILLTIITLGLYTPWARVRTRRYLYGNLHLGKYSFDYHADPNKMFKFFVLFYAASLLFVVTLNLMPEIATFVLPVYMICLVIAAPWIINRSLSFNARMTSFANIRFHYSGNYWGTFAILFLLPMLNIVTLSIAMPYIHKKFKEYFLCKHSWGSMKLGSHIPTGKLYKIFILSCLVPAMILAIIYVVGLMSALAGSTDMLMFLTNPVVALSTLVAIMLLPLGFIYYSSYIQIALLQNMHATFPDSDTETAEERLAHYQSLKYHKYQDDNLGRFLYFRSSQKPFKTSLKLIGNLILSALSLGLYMPYAIVKILKYSASCLTLCGNADLITQNQSAVSEKGGYAMDEMASASDLDIAI